MEKNENQQQINIEITEPEASGIYSNLAIISYTLSEFFLDFTRIVPGVPKAKILSRIITSPQHAKMLLFALQNNIQKYEETFGEIKLQENNPFQNFGFPPMPQDESVN